MGILAAVAYMSMKEQDRIDRLAAELRVKVAGETFWRDVVNGRAARRRSRGANTREWGSAFDVIIRDHIRTTLCLNQCTTALAVAVGAAAIQQGRLARERADARDKPDLLDPTTRGTPADRRYRIGAQWGGVPGTHRSWDFDVNLAVAYNSGCCVARTPQGLVAFQQVRAAEEPIYSGSYSLLVAKLLRTQKQVQLCRQHDGVFIYLDGVKHTVPEAFISLGLALPRPLPIGGSSAMPPPKEEPPPKMPDATSSEVQQLVSVASADVG